jgi:hypothetical protein
MKYDLKKLRKKLSISVTDIQEQFDVPSRQSVYYWERKKAYPQEVKDWMENKLKEHIEFKGEQNFKSVYKRLRELEKVVGSLEQKIDNLEEKVAQRDLVISEIQSK